MQGRFHYLSTDYGATFKALPSPGNTEGCANATAVAWSRAVLQLAAMWFGSWMQCGSAAVRCTVAARQLAALRQCGGVQSMVLALCSLWLAGTARSGGCTHARQTGSWPKCGATSASPTGAGVWGRIGQPVRLGFRFPAMPWRTWAGHPAAQFLSHVWNFGPAAIPVYSQARFLLLLAAPPAALTCSSPKTLAPAGLT